MKIAYILLAHNHPRQLLRLVKALEGTGDFYIHIDKKSDIREFQEVFSGMAFVHLLERRVNVTWAGFSMVKGYMLLLEAALASEEQYDRFVMLTGQDYPLMSNKEIIKTFEDNRDVEYIMAYNIATSPVPTDKDKVLKCWCLDNPFRSRFLQKVYKGIMYRVVTRPFSGRELRVPLNGKMVDPYFGQMLSAFTRKGANLLMNTYLNDKKYNKRMKTAFAAVELYWQTLFFNSELRKNTVQLGAEHEITEHFGWAPLHYHHYYVDTSVFTEEDFDELKNSGYMFCRKMVVGKSESLMDKIDEWRNEKENTDRIE